MKKTPPKSINKTTEFKQSIIKQGTPEVKFQNKTLSNVPRQIPQN